MGLTIHFTLRLSALLTPTDATARMSALHRAVAQLPFTSQSPLVSLDAMAVQAALSPDSQSAYRWACIQHRRRLSYRLDQAGVPRRMQPERDGCSGSIRIPANHLIGFSCWPGPGCQSLELFVGDYPATTTVDYVGRPPNRAHQQRQFSGDAPLRWTGSAFTKTQYSSDPDVGGVANFLRCHLLVIEALDRARDLGFLVAVDDEAGYWEHRNIPALIDEVRSRDDLMPQLGDELLDLISRTRGSLTPIPEAVTAPV